MDVMKNPIMVEAGKKAWATRRANAASGHVKIERPLDPSRVEAGKKAWETRRKNGTVAVYADSLDAALGTSETILTFVGFMPCNEGKEITLTGHLADFYQAMFEGAQESKWFDPYMAGYLSVRHPNKTMLAGSKFQSISDRQFTNLMNQLRQKALVSVGQDIVSLADVPCMWFPGEWFDLWFNK
jgi:hypothetical protein